MNLETSKEKLQDAEWFNRSPDYITDAEHAFNYDRSTHNFYLIAWWDELPVGFSRFAWDTKRQPRRVMGETYYPAVLDGETGDVEHEISAGSIVLVYRNS